MASDTITADKTADGKLRGVPPQMVPKDLPPTADLPTNYAEPQGNGGETHQTASDRDGTMTSQQGIPWATRRTA